MPSDKCHVVQEELALAAKSKRYVIVFFFFFSLIITVNLRQMIMLSADISHDNWHKNYLLPKQQTN